MHAPPNPKRAAAEMSDPAIASGSTECSSLVREDPAEIMKKPPRYAVGAADHHRGRADQSAQRRREIRQDLRFHGQEQIVMSPEFGGRSGARPAVPRLAAPLDDQAVGPQSSQRRRRAPTWTPPIRHDRERRRASTNGARPDNGDRWLHVPGLVDSATRYQSSLRVPIRVIASKKNIASAPNSKA